MQFIDSLLVFILVKVIQILPELNSGGVERGTLEVGQFLSKSGHNSVVISNGGCLVEQLEAEGSRHISLPVHKKHLNSIGQIKVLRSLFEKEQPDIIHLRSRLPAWLAWLAWHKMDPNTRPRLVTTVHGFNSINRYSKIMTSGEIVICVSNSVKDYVIEHYPDIPESKLEVVHRGVDPASYPNGYRPDQTWSRAWNLEFPETVNRKLVTLPGRITRLKGHEDFLKIIERLPSNYHGIIAGGAHVKKAAYLQEIKQLAKSMGIADQITFTGHRNDFREILAISDVILSLTQQPESFGRTTLEALCLGKPVLGYKHGGVGEILDQMFPQGKIEFGDVEAISNQILAWKQAPPALPRQENSLTLDQMLYGILSVYEKLSARK